MGASSSKNQQLNIKSQSLDNAKASSRLASSIYDPKKHDFIKAETAEDAWLDMTQSCVDVA